MTAPWPSRGCLSSLSHLSTSRVSGGRGRARPGPASQSSALLYGAQFDGPLNEERRATARSGGAARDSDDLDG